MGSQDEESGQTEPNERRGVCLPLCLDITKWLPVLFIISVISWSFYAFAIQLCVLAMTEVWLQILSLTIYHIFLILFLWSYWQTIFTKSGRVPRKFRISPSDLDRVESSQNEQEVNDVLDSIVRRNQLPVQTRTNISQIRYCEKCSIIKPDRCHHCSVCGRCILKMDHHCPWVNNCVCFDNYKFFVLFLVYAFLYCLVIFLFSLPYFIRFWSRDNDGTSAGPAGRFHILFVFFVAAMFAVSLISLFGYHCYLIIKNRSTLESFRYPIFVDGPDRKGFSLGSYYNFLEIFGENRKLWFLPIFTSLGDGISFPTRQNRNPGVTGNYNSIDTTDASSNTSPDYEGCTGIRVDPKVTNGTNSTAGPTVPSLQRRDTTQGQGHGTELNGNQSPPPPYSPTEGKNDSPLVYF